MDEHPIKTSVIIPVYNTEEYLPVCLDSVLAQTQTDIEVILVDDGSTDGSLAIERAYAARDPRVRIIQQPNLRQGTARNRGLAEARGEYIYFMDSDDYIVADHFETCYAACKEAHLDFVTFDTMGFRDDPTVERPDLFSEIKDRSGLITTDIVDGPTFWKEYFNKELLPFICWLEYFDRSFLLENDLKFVEGIYFEDNDWTVRVFMAAKRMRYLPRKLHAYRDRPGSNVHSGFSTVLAESTFDVHRIICNLMREHADDPDCITMLYGANGVKNQRFLQFNRLEPTDTLVRLIREFDREARRVIADQNEPDPVRLVSFGSLIHLAQGTALWFNKPLIPLTRNYMASIMLAGIPSEDSAHRIGIYGTGKACAAFMRLYKPGNQEYVFLDTSPEPGKTAFGKPVHAIDEAPSLGIDAMVITSEKYAVDMRRRIEEVLGPDMPAIVIPKTILLLEDCALADAVPFNGLRRIKRRLRILARKLMKKR